MRTNIVLDDRMVEEGFRLTHFKTKKQLVNFALEELVKRLRRKGLIAYRGKVKWTGNLDRMRQAR